MAKKRKVISFIAKWGAYLAKRGGGWYCHYCGRPIQRAQLTQRKQLNEQGIGIATIDHRQGRAKGGEKSNPKNMVLCCYECNQLKVKHYNDNYQSFKKVSRQ